MGRLANRFPVYSKLLHLYPARYRQAYGEQTLQTLADMLDDPDRSRFSVWSRAALDFPLSVCKQQLAYSHAIMKQEMPAYMKRSAALGAILLLPFFMLITINSLVRPGLPSTTPWKLFFLVLLIGFPAIACLLNIAALLHWARERRQTSKISLRRSLVDLHHTWATTLVACLGLMIALFIPFHDSVRCVSGNPIRELHNPRDTLRCIQR